MPPSAPVNRNVDLGSGRFRTLEWAGVGAIPVVFLHGLSGVADVWTDTVAALGAARPRCVALDQRGHGHSPRTPGSYAANDLLGDLVDLVDHLGAPVHLVGHSMGARVAILAAARHPERIVSAAIVDIGPEAWNANITATARSFSSLPERFANRDEALAFGRLSKRGDVAAQRFVEWRLRAEDDGSFTWLASPDALVECVSTQRARNYWRDWEQVAIPAVLVRGGTSKELRPFTTSAMRKRNPSVGFVEIPDVAHNIPLLAPDRLAQALMEFWSHLR